MAPERVELDDERVPWRVDFPSGVVGLAATPERLYVASGQPAVPTPKPDEDPVTGRLTAISLPDGEPSFSVDFPAPVGDGPVVHAGDPYAVVGYSNGYDGRDQRLLRMSPEGEIRWESPHRDAWLRLYDFDADSVYLGTGDDGLSSTGETTFAVDLSNGTERWSVAAGDAGVGRVAGETLYASYAGPALAAVETADGTERWRRAVESLQSREQAVPTTDGALFARIEGDDAAGFGALETADGSTRWERPGVNATSATPVADLVVGTGYDGTVFAVDIVTGETRWSRQFTGRPELPLVVNGQLFVVFSEGPFVSLDPATGETNWRVGSWAGRYIYHLSAEEGTLVSAASGQEEAVVTGRSSRDGSQRWQRRLPGRSRAVGRAAGVLAIATGESVYGVLLGQAETA